MNKISALGNALIWFGAAISVAEFITGTYFAPLGFYKGVITIVIGHIVGCLLLFFAGYIGALSKKSSMETTKISFGSIGAKFFAFLNVVQLVGWTGIMIYDSAVALNGIFEFSKWIWCVVIGGLIIVWIVIGLSNIEKINIVAVSALFILTLFLSKVIFFDKNITSVSISENMSFGAGIELAIAMPLSWLPLISDYTKNTDKPFKTTLVSSVVYCFASCWMYIIGLGAALFVGSSDLAQIMKSAGIGVVGLVIIILSTVTTTFLDAYSAGVSSKTVFCSWNEKIVGVAVTFIGIVCAIIFPMDNITDFLYLIGSVFAPMISIVIADYFVVHQDSSCRMFNPINFIIWIIGFALYRVLMRFDLIIGCTIVTMFVVFLLTVVVGTFLHKNRKLNDKF